MSRIKRCFEDNHSTFVSSSKPHSERKNSFTINSRENFSKIILEKGVFLKSGNITCECVFIREVNDETYFLELKGRSSNVIKGIEQVMNSISSVNRFVALDDNMVNGFVIGSSTPSKFKAKKA